MYDGYVGGMLYHFRNDKEVFDKGFKSNDLKNYKGFFSIFEAFSQKMPCNDENKPYTFKEIDQFLWYCGKKLKEYGITDVSKKL